MSRISNLLVFGLVGFVGLPGIAKSDRTVGSDLRISVRVFNYAEIPVETWMSTEVVASRIFNRAGITTVWLDCSLAPDGRYLLEECNLPVRAAEIILRIVPSSPATYARFGARTLGIAAPPQKGIPGSVSVFFDRVEELTKGGTASSAVILGHAAAHEIGHLLLGSNSHSNVGLMRASWSRADLGQANSGELVFSQRETVAIRERVQQTKRKAETACGSS